MTSRGERKANVVGGQSRRTRKQRNVHAVKPTRTSPLRFCHHALSRSLRKVDGDCGRAAAAGVGEGENEGFSARVKVTFSLNLTDTNDDQ